MNKLIKYWHLSTASIHQRINQDIMQYLEAEGDRLRRMMFSALCKSHGRKKILKIIKATIGE